MNINRNNYEEFLLLYIDGELSTTQQKEVEIFLEQHTDIKQELSDLLDTKLQIEEVSFGDISALLKNEINGINLNNYQEHFLLFVDNELSKENKEATEIFVLQHPVLQNEFIALQQTKLPIETIECPNKEELYKKQRKPIVFYLQRIAVAAVFIGIGAFVFNLFGTNKKPESIASIPQNVVIKTNTIPKNKQPNSLNPVIKKDEIGTNNIRTKSNKIVAKEPVININANAENEVEKNIENVVTNNILVTLNNQESILQNKNTAALNNNTSDNVKQQTQNNQVASIETVSSLASTLNPQTLNASTIVYNPLDEKGINGKEKKQSKLKKFFKNAIKIITPKETLDDESKKLFVVTL